MVCVCAELIDHLHSSLARNGEMVQFPNRTPRLFFTVSLFLLANCYLYDVALHIKETNPFVMNLRVPTMCVVDPLITTTTTTRCVGSGLHISHSVCLCGRMLPALSTQQGDEGKLTNLVKPSP